MGTAVHIPPLMVLVIGHEENSVLNWLFDTLRQFPFDIVDSSEIIIICANFCHLDWRNTFVTAPTTLQLLKFVAVQELNVSGSLHSQRY